MYYGWNNSVSLTGFVGYVPYEFTSKSGKKMMRFDLYIPRYNVYPIREGQAKEALPPLKIAIIGGESMVRLIKKRRVHTGDIAVVTGQLINFETEKNGVVFRVYYVEPINITILKGYRGMRAIDFEEQAIYNELLKEIKSNGTNDNSGDNNSTDSAEGS